MTATQTPLGQPALDASICNAMETLAFISPLPIEGGCLPPADPLLVSISFTGSCTGELLLAAPRAFAAMLAANILAGSPDDPDIASGAADALKELANVICGAVIFETPGAQRDSVEMGLPQCRCMCGESEWREFTAAPGTSLFDADGHVVAARFNCGPVSDCSN